MQLFKKCFSAFLAVFVLFLSFGTTKAYARDNTELYSIYRMSPYSVRQTFEQTGWSLQLTDNGVLNLLYGAASGNTAGVTVYQDHTIYLSDKNSYASLALNHEMGHFFDYVYGLLFGMMPSQTKDFAEIFFQEAISDKYFENYATTSASEYFAQSYKYFCEDPTVLWSRPLTYSYLLNLVKNYDRLFDRGFYIEDDFSILPDEVPPVDDDGSIPLPVSKGSNILTAKRMEIFEY